MCNYSQKLVKKNIDIYEPEFVKKLFNQMSSSYDRMNFITSFGFSILWRKQFINKIEHTNKEIKVLDLLSGLGENWNILIRKYPNAKFTGLDFSEEMVAKSREKNQKKLGNSFHVLQQDILNNDISSNEYDRIFCAFGLKTFNEEQLNILAKNLYRILKKDGQFSFIEISKPKNPILLFFYSFYLGKVIPILGKLFLGNPDDYKMLWTYTANFKDCSTTKSIFEKHNLKVEYHKYFWGCATGITGKINDCA